MDDQHISNLLDRFRDHRGIFNKGQLCVMLVVTRMASKSEFPFSESDFVTEGTGQVRGLGKSAVQAILADHAIDKVLAEEGGRTSRGSLGLMRQYLAFLNENEIRPEHLQVIEGYWIGRVREFFAAKPFQLKYDASKTLKASILELIQQAEQRQREAPGTTYVGALYQHLVAAKLRVILKSGAVEVHGYAVADGPSSRKGDFQIEDSVIHVTTFPTESLLRKAEDNLKANLKPIIITSERGFAVASAMAQNAGFTNRIEIIELSQFLSTNLLEWSQFSSRNHEQSLQALIRQYNDIVGAVETDPSLLIQEG